MGLGGSDGEGGGSGSGSPMAVTPAVFPLPHEYEAAKERKVASVADLRNAVKTVRAALSISVAVRDVCSTHPCLDAVRNRLRRCQRSELPGARLAAHSAEFSQGIAHVLVHHCLH